MSKANEKYKSKKQMMKHERTESKRDRMMEYGKGGKMSGNGCTNRKSCS